MPITVAIFGFIMSSSFLIAGAWAFLFSLRDIRRGRASKSWPTTTGKITFSGIKKVSDSEGTFYFPDISYEYSVDGVTYLSDAIHFGPARGFAFPSSARKRASKYTVGMPVTVYYNPEDPNIAVLEPGIRTSSFIFLGLGALSFIIGLFIFSVLIYWLITGSPLITNLPWFFEWMKK